MLDALRTVEADCLRNKESLDRLFALIVGHTPELLSVMAEVQQPEGYVSTLLHACTLQFASYNIRDDIKYRLIN